MVIPGPEEAEMEGTKPTLFCMHIATGDSRHRKTRDTQHQVWHARDSADAECVGQHAAELQLYR